MLAMTAGGPSRHLHLYGSCSDIAGTTGRTYAGNPSYLEQKHAKPMGYCKIFLKAAEIWQINRTLGFNQLLVVTYWIQLLF